MKIKILVVIFGVWMWNSSLEACLFTKEVFFKHRDEKEWKVYQREITVDIQSTQDISIIVPMGYPRKELALFWVSHFTCGDERSFADIALESNPYPFNDYEWYRFWQKRYRFENGISYYFFYQILDWEFKARMAISAPSGESIF